jgi:transposase
VLFVDECHLMSGDLQGYVWGRTGERVEVPIVNERERQTYYGALDLLSKRLLVQAHAKGNTTSTIEYLKFLQTQWPEQRLLILWDGASYHRSQELQVFLAQVNEGLEPEAWQIHCVRFAPNDPSQNPIEDAWLQAKTWLRRMSGLRPCFKALKALFEQFFRLEVFDFPKMHRYGSFSQFK